MFAAIVYSQTEMTLGWKLSSFLTIVAERHIAIQLLVSIQAHFKCLKYDGMVCLFMVCHFFPPPVCAVLPLTSALLQLFCPNVFLRAVSFSATRLATLEICSAVMNECVQSQMYLRDFVWRQRVLSERDL